MKNLQEYSYDELKELIAKCNPYHNFDFAEDIEEDILYHIMECDNNNEIRGFFNEIIDSGCRNGTTNIFMYCDESRDFYIKHMDSMEDFMLQYDDEWDISLVIDRKLPRYIQICWFCYEELARNIYDNMFSKK